jgi:uncharacterized protein (DUF1499 family)
VSPEIINNSCFKSVIQLPDCPRSPNCYKKIFETDLLNFEEAIISINSVLENMNAEEVRTDHDSRVIHAVFKIPLFGWKDDFHIHIGSHNGTIHLNIRSASRSGNYDLGVNKRRVHRFIRDFEVNKLNK